MKPFADFDQTLRAEGFEPGAPSGEVAAQDEGICVRLACPECRRPGLVYRPYVSERFRRPPMECYRPLAVCGACGQAREF